MFDYKKWRKEYLIKNKERVKKYRLEYDKRPEVKVRKKIAYKKWYLSHQEYVLVYRKKHKERTKQVRAIRDSKIALKLQEYRKKYYSNPIVKERQKLWFKNNIDKKRGYARKYNLNPLTNLHNRLRRSLNHRLKDKYDKTSKLLPYTFEELKKHLEANFLDGMSWDNRHLWDIDHKIPITFAKSDKEVIELYALDNLQPLWKKQNISKSNRHIADLFGSGSWFK